ncbi:retrovirus-related pol polyprotein from transposon TNT 1-94 [Tanacetum coccineum]|uniref:Retrovirus-related pol polyprotein from transposon TNT 1-94 n=1 Tax=Tanacetum coccineum TaxID=301880 RepID=A0ABQ4YW23_9ASTR
MYTASLKRSENYKAQPYQYASSSKQILKAKANPFPPSTHYGFNDHGPGDCRNYPKCGICRSYDHFTSGNNHVIHIRGGMLAESSSSSKSSIGVKYNTCGSTVHSTTNYNDFDHFKRGEKIQATKAREPTKNRCSSSMTGVKSYLHKYIEQPGPKVVFGDNSSCITEGYGSINCGGIVFTKVAFVNGLKYNLISISQLCDAKYIVEFDDKQGTIFNANKEIVQIAPRRNDVYVLDMCDNRGLSTIVPVVVKFFVGIFWKAKQIVGVRTYLLGGAMMVGRTNGIIRNPKLELESYRFTFDLVPLSYKSVDVIIGDNWLLRHKAEMNGISYGISTRSDADLRRLVSFDVFRKARGCVKDTMKFMATPFGFNNAPAVFMELMSRMLYRGVGRRSEAKNEFEIDVRRSDLEMESGSYWLDKVRTSIWRDVRTLAIEEAYTTKYSIHLGADTMLCGFRLTNRWLSMKKDIAVCDYPVVVFVKLLLDSFGKLSIRIDQLSELQGKSKRASHPPKPVPNSKQRLHLLHMDLCGPMRIASINGKWYVLVIVDDFSRYTWVHFLRSKDEAPEVIKTFLKRITVLLQALVIIVRTDNGTEFKNQVLQEYFNCVGISHQTSSVRTPQQNGVVERRNRMLVEAARTMLIFSRASLFLWAEVIATACYTQNRSIIHPLCYPKNDHEDIGKLGTKGDIGFFISYSANSCAYRVYNRRTKKIMETINVTFNELSALAFEQSSSKPGLQSMTSGQISSGLALTYAPSTITTQKLTEGDLDLLFEAIYDDYLGGQPSATPRTILDAQAPPVLQNTTTSTTIADSAPTPTDSSPQAQNIPNSSQDVDELETQQQHVQQQENEALLQPKIVADNVPNAMFDGNRFVNPFATLSTNVDYARCKDTFKSTSGGAQFLGEKLVSWSSRNKTVRRCLPWKQNMCLYPLAVPRVILFSIHSEDGNPSYPTSNKLLVGFPDGSSF